MNCHNPSNYNDDVAHALYGIVIDDPVVFIGSSSSLRAHVTRDSMRRNRFWPDLEPANRYQR